MPPCAANGGGRAAARSLRTVGQALPPHARSKGFQAIDLGLGGDDISGIVGERGALVRRRGGVEHPKREADQDVIVAILLMAIS